MKAVMESSLDLELPVLLPLSAAAGSPSRIVLSLLANSEGHMERTAWSVRQMDFGKCKAMFFFVF